MSIDKYIDKLREMLKENVITKDIPITEESDLTKDDEINEIFDIDIFVSRKPGMRRSVQYISTNSPYAKISFMTALCSLLDTAISSPQLDMSEDEVLYV